MPSIMVTGSHIPDDRNGLKFNKPAGEVLKADEKGIGSQIIVLDAARFGADGNFAGPPAPLRAVSAEAGKNYVARYLNCFSRNSLQGCRLGVYQHSAVGRDILVEILSALGADITPLGRSDKFIAVDTEAIRPEDAQLAKDWAATNEFDAIVSLDGDSDRPLVSDEHGHWLRGDMAGILCAKFLEADSISTPVSCNTAVEKCGWFREVRRTRIGSPNVIASMMLATAHGAKCAVGYEANGGFLLNSDLEIGGKKLRALPTRDSLILILSLLLLAKSLGKKVSELAATLPARFTASDRLKDFATEKGRDVLARFNTGAEAADRQSLEKVFGGLCGRVANLDRTDGLRITFANDEIIHLRPSGTAPEFRCYAEASIHERARWLSSVVLEKISAL